MKRITLGKSHYVEAKTHSELMNKIRKGYCWTFSSSGCGSKQVSSFARETRNGRELRLYNIHKQRPKKSHDHKTQVREGKWYGYVYDVNLGDLNSFKKVYVKQHSRNFDLLLEI